MDDRPGRVAELLGSLDVQEFETRDGQLVAVGTLSGQVTRLVGTVAEPVATLIEAPLAVPIGAVAARCDRLSVTFGPTPLNLHAPILQVEPIRVDGADRTAKRTMSEARLCRLADQFRTVTAPSLQAGLLDSVVRSFD